MTDPLHITGWLAVRKTKQMAWGGANDLIGRWSLGKPELARDELAVRITVRVRESAFNAPPLAAEVDVPEAALIMPPEVVVADAPE